MIVICNRVIIDRVRLAPPLCAKDQGTRLVFYFLSILTAAMSQIENEISRIKKEINAVAAKKRDRLKNLDFYILDNSIRESTVGQLRSHTLANKLQIYEHVKACGIKDIIVASFANLTRVDDDFCQYLRDHGEDFSRLYSFSEVKSEGIKDGAYDTESIPVSLRKNKRYGLRNVVLEFDLVDNSCKWDEKFKVEDMWVISGQINTKNGATSQILAKLGEHIHYHKLLFDKILGLNVVWLHRYEGTNIHLFSLPRLISLTVTP